MTAPEPNQQRNRGSASVIMVGVGLCLLLVAAAVSSFGMVVEARHRAQVGADAAALAGAMRAIEGAEAACGRARELAAVNGTAVNGCKLTGLDLTVEVTASLPSIMSGWGAARGVATAGPVVTDGSRPPAAEL